MLLLVKIDTWLEMNINDLLKMYRKKTGCSTGKTTFSKMELLEGDDGPPESQSLQPRMTRSSHEDRAESPVCLKVIKHFN
jgi:hypothetical protein